MKSIDIEMQKEKQLTYIDLFAGCGGFSLGLYNSKKWKGIFAIEKDPMAFETFQFNLINKKQHFNWPQWLPQKHHDIDNVLIEYNDELHKLEGKVDLIVGGPPCQGFSCAGRRLESDKRNKLIYAYLEFVKIIKPRVILFENVKGFSIGFKQKNNMRGIPYSKIVLDELIKIGYTDACYKIVNFADYGVPQYRKRVIIAASLNDIFKRDFFNEIQSYKRTFIKKKGLAENLTLFNVISDLEKKYGVIDSPDTHGFMAGLYSNESISNFQLLMRKGCKQDNPDSHRFAKHNEKITSKFEQIIKHKLSSKQVQFEYNTKKSRTHLLTKESIPPTLTTLPDDLVHYSEPRILTVREYARIQTFPDWYEFKGKYTTGGKLRKKQVPRYTQVGNAVPPFFSELCGHVIPRILDER